MSAVPPSCFDWPRGSGYPVIYGGATILTDGPIRTYNRSNVIVVSPSGGGVPGYCQFLDTRYDTPPSGWNG